MEAVLRTTGIAIEVLSGEEEARLSALGVLSVFQELSGSVCIFDLGGGSVEFTWVQTGEIKKTVSLPLGAVGLSEQFLLIRSPAETRNKAPPRALPGMLRKGISTHDSISCLIGTAGTVTTLTAMSLKDVGVRPIPD